MPFDSLEATGVGSAVLKGESSHGLWDGARVPFSRRTAAEVIERRRQDDRSRAADRPTEFGEFELWNMSPCEPMLVGAQRIVNILGRVKDPDAVETFSYSLNGGPWTPIFFKKRGASADRLEQDGDFNIDTIEQSQLHGTNLILFGISSKDGRHVKRSCSFRVKFFPQSSGAFCLNLQRVGCAQEVGQLVNGHWRLGRSGNGEPCLEICREDVGLDRIILFGHAGLRSGYTIRARLCVTEWLGHTRNVGLLFRWNPHRQGDGTHLPSQWSTGLGYYYSHCRGLRVRVGVDVHLNERGEKIGDYVLGEAVLLQTRYWTSKIFRRLCGTSDLLPQVVPGRQYVFELSVQDDAHALTVWPAGRPRPSPKIVVRDPPELLRSGAVGIIAHRCAVQVYEFELLPD